MEPKRNDRGIEKDERNETPAKTRNRSKLLAYLSDPENGWPKRSEYSTLILGYGSENQVYKTLSPDELTAIEAEAIEIRKKKTARQRAMTLQALYRRAVGYDCKDTKFFKTSKDKIISQTYTKHYPPDPAAAKEFLDRVEGKVPAKLEHTGKIELGELSDEQLDKRLELLLKKAAGENDGVIIRRPNL